jgi:PAS domain S-box-containing protein
MLLPFYLSRCLADISRSFSAGWGGGLALLGVLVPGKPHDLEDASQFGPGTLLESIPDSVFLFDTGGLLLDCNQLARDLCNQTREQLRGISIASLNHLLSARDEFDHPVEIPSMGVNRALRGEIVRNVRRTFRHTRDGHLVETVTSASPLYSPSGELRGALFIVRDVTEILQLQRRLANAQRHREVGQMAAGLAHDFDNVLDTVVKAAALLDMSENLPAEKRRAYTRMIRNAAARGAEIVQRVRDYLRSDSDNRTLVDIRQVLHDALELTHPLWYTRNGMAVIREIQSVPPVWANAADLRRVFANLIINALEAMPDGGRLLVRCESNGGHVRAMVSDTGQGIPPEHQAKLFEPYFTTKPEGTGLGLSGAQRIVNSLRGRIAFNSDSGKGSTFVVELPVAESVSDQAA